MHSDFVSGQFASPLIVKIIEKYTGQFSVIFVKAFNPIYILPLVILGFLAGITGGWIRLGYLEWYSTGPAANHGILMVGGFLGTLIPVERALVWNHQRMVNAFDVWNDGYNHNYQIEKRFFHENNYSLLM